MFFDNIIIFFNVLEQFAIKVTIVNFSIDDFVYYICKLFVINNDGLSKVRLALACQNNKFILNPERIAVEKLRFFNKSIASDIKFFHKLEFMKIYSLDQKKSFKFIY